MGKNVVKDILIDIAVGVIVGHILALSTSPSSVPPIHQEAEPKLMYVQHCKSDGQQPSRRTAA
ncbi:hypothetical protein NS212_03445 [Pseudomonas parafulva]|nr:hypothetical protein NS212_03445 [Pseudomonas parafulva]